MMRIVSRRLLLLPFALVLLASACGVPLPAPELTATAQSQVLVEPAGGSQVQSSSSGAPSNSALSLQQSVSDGQQPSALAPLENQELAGTPAAIDAAEDGTPAPETTEEATPEPDVTEEATPEPTAESTPEATEVAVDPSTYSSDLLALINQVRANNGIPSLQFDAALTVAAMDYARYMASTGFFGHYPPDGTTPTDRIVAAGFQGQYKGEALSAGQATPGVAASRLLSSSQHASILLNSTAIGAGVGYYYDLNSYYGHYWVVVTANP